MALTSRSNHNSRCATAVNHLCRCTGCAGSMHGWPGWLHLATAPDQLATRRQEVDAKWPTNPPGHRLNDHHKQVITDWARLDLAEWLHDANTRPAPGSTELPYPAPVDQVSQLAKSTTEAIWPEIAKELESRTEDATTIKRELAHHIWCDIFAALAAALTDANRAIDKVAESTKLVIKRAALGSSMQQNRPNVTSLVVDLIVDRAWRAFKTIAASQLSPLAIITSEDLVRSLRILALFSCPAPERHREVLEHSLNPLLNDARKVVKSAVKAYAVRLVKECLTPHGLVAPRLRR